MNQMKSFGDDFSALCKSETKDMIVIADSLDTIKLTYADVWQLVKRYLAFFEKENVKKGDTVVTILPNSAEAIICFFAAACAGINYAPLPCTVTAREFENWKALTKPAVCIVKKDIVEFDIDVKSFFIETDASFSWLSENAEEYEKTDYSSKVYLMTSGTTGEPKAMQIDVNTLWSSGYAFSSEYGIVGSGVRFWNYLPMSYLGGLFNLALIPLCCKGSFVVSEPFSGKTMLNFWGFVKKYEITALWFVPSIVKGLLKIYSLVGKKYEELYKTIAVSFLGTAPIELSVKEEFEAAFGIRLYENFALSETTFLTAETKDNIRFREPSSVGQPLSYAQIKLVPIADIERTCEIWVKTPYMFDGYLGKDGSLVRQMDEDGFFNSKDLGYFNEDGQLVLGGRSRDIIKKGGLFVSLVEIEHAVLNIDYVDEASAVPVKHEFYGETYVLCVIFKNKENEAKQIEVLRKWLIDNFVHYKLPEDIVAFNDFPTTASGKIVKKELAERIKEGKNE